MKTVANPFELERKFDVLLNDHSVADIYRREDCLKALCSSLRRNDYFSFVDAKTTVSNYPMFEIWVTYPVARRQPDWVQRDIGNAWARVTEKALESEVAFRMTQNGFEAVLLAKFNQTIISARIYVRGVQLEEYLGAS